MGTHLNHQMPIRTAFVRQNAVKPAFAGEKPKNAERKRMEVSLSGLLTGVGKQMLKGNFGVIGAFFSYQKDLETMREVLLKKLDFQVKPGGVAPEKLSDVKLDNAAMREFAKALGGGAEGMLKLFVAQGMDRDTIRFKDGFLETLKNFGVAVDEETGRRYFLQPESGPEVPLYASALNELHARCQAQNIQPVRGTLDEAFSLMRKAAMPSGRLSDAVAIMKDVESRF